MSDFKFEFGRPQIKNISREMILDELERVAKHFNYSYFLRKDFNEIASIHSATVERNFGGSWSQAMLALKKKLEHKNIILSPGHRRNIPEKAMFDEMERIWVELGHRPSRSEWTTRNPGISYDSIYRRFGGWTNACLKFIEYKSGEAITAVDGQHIKNKELQLTHTGDHDVRKNLQKTRTVSLNIRFKILNRDNFRCVFCGKSPATDSGTKLHIDHIIPFSKGGTNSIDNLQTLCEQCNLGKSNTKIDS